MGRMDTGKTVWVVGRNGQKYRRSISQMGGSSIPTDGRAMGVHKVDEPLIVLPESSAETDEQIAKRLDERMAIIGMMADTCIAGDTPALIVSGPAGLGKTWEVLQSMMRHDPNGHRHTFRKGFSRATGVFKDLYEFRFPGNVLIYDDCDSVFKDPVALNIFKSALDTTEKRVISWGTEAEFFIGEGDAVEKVPRHFEYEGSVIFITNYDFDMVSESHSLKKDFDALISRSHYVNMGVKSRHDYIVRIRQVVYEKRMLEQRGLNADGVAAVMKYIEDNQNSLRELTLRMAIKVGNLYVKFPKTWQNVANATCKKAQ